MKPLSEGRPVNVFSSARIRAAFACSIAFGLCLAASGASPPSYKNFQRALEAIKHRDPNTALQIKQIISDNQPFFLIVPGILGSKLVDEHNRVVWGAIGTEALLRSDPTRLRYPDRKLRADVMLSFDFISGYKMDVYGPLISAVSSMDVGGADHWAIYPYDWRQSISDSAAGLDARIRSAEWTKRMRGRDVVIVAHSMGGLVTTWWYEHYYLPRKDTYEFPITNLFLLGVPNRGAASSLLSIVNGYGPSKASWIERRVFGLVFHDLNAAAVTFPGLFDLLPEDEPVHEINGTVSGDVHLFNVDVWKRYDWASAARASAHQAPDRFYMTLAPMLRAAADMYSALRVDGELPIDKTYYFFSRNHQTPAGVDMAVRGSVEHPLYEARWKFTDGDERVPWESAVPPGVAHAYPDHAIELRESHGGLPNDPSFVDYVQNYRWSHVAMTNVAFIKLAHAKPFIIDEMRRNGAFLELPSSPSALETPAARQTAVFNTSIAYPSSSQPARRSYLASKTTASAASRVQLLETSVARGDAPPAEQRSFNLGVALLESGHPAAAIEHLLAALKDVPDLPSESRAAYEAKVHANLGVAYERTRDYALAVHEYQAAGNYTKAKVNLKRLNEALEQ